ncbi:ROK family transcriptional regulator [Gottfriedia luciferensis]|uniref:ROK family transcriptional regulator n=1 Tax=Gottfriedia luciferensis TaxID=178774 RepID=UPI000B44DD02|nr:ROK family transcriptional regulator [Gottfriedia luciferensis]
MIRDFVGYQSPKTKSLKLLYSLIRKLGPIKVSSLTEMTGYKHTTCVRLIDELVQAGLVYDSGLGESSGGRRPVMYVINPTAFYLIGVEITNLFTTVLLLDLNLKILETKKLKMDSQSTGEYTIDFVTKSVSELLARNHIQRERLLGIGIGILDPFDEEKGVMTNSDSFVAGGWEDLNIVDYLSEANQCPVLINNGTNLAALAEYRLNYSKENKNIVFVSSDMGIRCGMIQQGKLISNKNEMDDAFGHMIIDIHGQRCSCGSYGCLQAYSSLPAIREEVVKRIKRGETSYLKDIVNDLEEISYHQVLEALEKEDPLCLEVIKEAAYYFGIGLTNLIYLVRTDIVICGGTLVPKPLFFDVASEIAQSRMKKYPNSPVKIIKSTTAYHIVAQGAGCMVLDYFTEELLS